MMKMNEKRLARWTQTRQMGRTKFIWLRGVLGWGVTTAVLSSLIMTVFQGFPTFLFRLGIAMILFPIGGYFWGIWVWELAEKQYLAVTKHNAT